LRKWEIYFRGEKSNDTTTSKRRQKENAGENLLAGCRLLFSRSLSCASQFHSIVYIFLYFFLHKENTFSRLIRRKSKEKKEAAADSTTCAY